MTDELKTLKQEIVPEQAPGTVPPEKKMSKGERLFDVAIYTGIAGIGVFAASLPLTYWSKYGKGISTYNWAKSFLKKKGVSESAAEQIYNTTVLGLAGNAAVIPIKIIEDRKPEIVTKLNEALGDTTGDMSVENEPKQTWGSLVKSRVAAYAAVWTTFQGAVSMFGAKAFGKFEDDFAKHIVCDPLGKPTHINGQETKLFRYGKIGALDVFATAGAAGLLYVGSRFFAKGNEDKWDNHPDNEKESAPVPAIAAAPNTEAASIVQSTNDKASHFTDKHTKPSSYAERATQSQDAGHHTAV
jgi:hypothetical protein